ncbi:related to multicopper oxidase [Sporisorium reilianum SRZ2]|uniref:Related to multicopper oxidase n=1 Tax=Sporisorium reilianum (strain SRZ2) TaxID=999809 RepID=E6ZWM8_SPORE|nr:related to multicopper oxidase [Sporisorium reilianum SRZ2]
MSTSNTTITMRDRKPALLLAILALSLLCWCTLQWCALLRSIDVLTPSHPWWSASKTATPRVQYHEWNITRADIAPDGVARPMVLVNSRFPGPGIEAVVGDTIVVRVNNFLLANSSFARWDAAARARFSTRVHEYYPRGSDEQVAIHWHGLAMRGSPEQDGAPGFASCAVPPGGSRTYRFRVAREDVGTHWWHSHAGMARADGLWGTLVVRDPSERVLLEPLKWHHEQVITLADHYFAPGIDQLSWFLSRHSLGFEPTPDNMLINGQGTFDCARLLDRTAHNCSSASTPPRINLEHGKTHRLRFVNVGSVGHQTVSLDEHVLTVIEADGVVVQPYETTRLSIAPGQRYSVLVTADRSLKKFWLRAEMDSACFNVANPNLSYHATAIVSYSSTPQFELELRSKTRRRNILRSLELPQTQAWARRVGEQACHDEPARLLRPLRARGLGVAPTPPLDLAKDRREVVTVSMPKLDRNGLVPVSWINRTQWRSPSTPLLHTLALSTNTTLPTFDPTQQTVLTPSLSAAATLELVINNADEAPHPFHLHGHKFALVALSESRVGIGAFATANPDAEWFSEHEAPVRDTVSVPRRGFAVVRWTADNAGVWALHCHVLVHMQTGMALAVVERADEMRRLPFVEALRGGAGSCTTV